MRSSSTSGSSPSAPVATSGSGGDRVLPRRGPPSVPHEQAVLASEAEPCGGLDRVRIASSGQPRTPHECDDPQSGVGSFDDARLAAHLPARDDDPAREADGAQRLTSPMLAALLEAFAQSVAEPDVRVIILTGAGHGFSAGPSSSPSTRAVPTRCGAWSFSGALFEAVATCRVPTIAAVSGQCFDGAAELVAACDLRIADATATFRFSGAALGYPLGAAKLVGLVGLGAAKDLALSPGRGGGGGRAHRPRPAPRRVTGRGRHGPRTRIPDRIERPPHGALSQALVRPVLRHLGDRVSVEADALRNLAESGGDYRALERDDGGVGAWAGGGRRGR
jgi:hypothetical protein